MRNSLFGIVEEFGFPSLKALYISLLAPKQGLLFIALSGITSIGDYFFGVSNFTLILLIVLIKIELITGIWASRVRKKKIVSKKLQRFILKLGIYFFFIMMFYKLGQDAKDFTKNIYAYMHSFVILYFVFVHVKSIGENYGRITGKKTDFTEIIKKFANKMLGLKEKDNSDNTPI